MPKIHFTPKIIAQEKKKPFIFKQPDEELKHLPFSSFFRGWRLGIQLTSILTIIRDND
jgi:hypothetical protein